MVEDDMRVQVLRDIVLDEAFEMLAKVSEQLPKLI